MNREISIPIVSTVKLQNGRYTIIDCPARNFMNVAHVSVALPERETLHEVECLVLIDC